MAKTPASPCLYSIRGRACGNKTNNPAGLCPKHVGKMLDEDVDKRRKEIPRVNMTTREYATRPDMTPKEKAETYLDRMDIERGAVFSDDPLRMRVMKDVRWHIHRATGLFRKEFRN